MTLADEDAPRSFDKVVWATGVFLRPKRVNFEGQALFKGRIIHSQDVRDLADFKDQNVIVLGIGNTAGDVAINVQPHAKNVYISHRRAATIFRRTDPEGVPEDIRGTATLITILWWIETYVPWLFAKVMVRSLLLCPVLAAPQFQLPARSRLSHLRGISLLIFLRIAPWPRISREIGERTNRNGGFQIHRA